MTAENNRNPDSNISQDNEHQFKVGDRVRVVSRCAFYGLEGVIVRTHPDSFRFAYAPGFEFVVKMESWRFGNHDMIGFGRDELELVSGGAE